MTNSDPHFPKQAVAVFESPEALEDALDRLVEAEFDQERLSVIGLKDTLDGKLKGVHSTVDLASLHQPTRPDGLHKSAPLRRVEMNELRAAAIGFPAYVGALLAGSAAIASGGLALPVIIATVSGGAGGALLGGIFTAWLNKRRADYYSEQVARGGILLWVTLDDNEAERKAREILPSFSIEPVRIIESTAQDAAASGTPMHG